MKMRNIAVDIGNTRIKSGVFENNELIDVRIWSSILELRDHFKTEKGIQWGFSSVKNESEITEGFAGLDFTMIRTSSDLPIKLDYKTPETLGVDRIMGVIGGRQVVKEGPLLVVDLGTCITYDLLTENDVYMGGAISPGLLMRMRAMHQQTGKLPDASPVWRENLSNGIGKSTIECLVQGSFTAIILEIDGFINIWKKDLPDLAVILTGGDAPSFESKLKEPIFADQNLVLRGINRTLNTT